MAQIRENGQVSSTQVLVGSLTHYVVEAGAANVLVTGWDVDGAMEAGEELFVLVNTICNPVLWEISDANTVFFAAEVAGHDAAAIEAAINASDTFTGATVTVGTYSVTV